MWRFQLAPLVRQSDQSSIITLMASRASMHLHGFYFRTESKGNGLADSIYAPEQRRMGVTEILPPFGTMYRLRRRPPHPVSLPAAVAVAELLDPTTQRILVVEDSDFLRAEAVRTLSARGYAVAEARHGHRRFGLATRPCRLLSRTARRRLGNGD